VALPSWTGFYSTTGIGGFHAGYNYQMSSIWVLGVEGDWDRTKFDVQRRAGNYLLKSLWDARSMRWRHNLSDHAFVQIQAAC
jgi:hypothetical protein